MTVFSSELTLLETLVRPPRLDDQGVAARREALWRQAGTLLLPITREVLREAARLRAAIPTPRTPDAIHAATALLHGCAMFLSNVAGFRQVPCLPLILLDDVTAEP